MTRFQEFGISQDISEVKNALEAAFGRHGLEVPVCKLLGSQANTVIEVRADLKEHGEIVFSLPLESTTDGTLEGTIEMGIRLGPSGQSKDII